MSAAIPTLPLTDPQLIVVHTLGLQLDAFSHYAPQASYDRPMDSMPPVSMASLPLGYGGFPVFQDAMFRLDDLCPHSHQAKLNWLAEHAVGGALPV
jgi:hypothetical protein